MGFAERLMALIRPMGGTRNYPGSICETATAIHCGHVDLQRLGIMAIPRALFLGRGVVRAQEYTADRCAAYYAPEGAKSMMALFAGKRTYRRIDLDAYYDSVDNHKDGFWMKFANFWSDHAVGFRRMQPLRNIEQTGWDVHGKML